MFRATDRPETTLETNLAKLETVWGRRGQIKFGKDVKGHVVVEIAPRWSLLLWLKNTFGNRRAMQTLHDQAILALSNDNTPKSLKERIVKDINCGILPFVNSHEKKQISSLTFADDQRISNQSSHFKPAVAKQMARREMSRLLTKLPGVSVADAISYIRARQSIALVDPQGAGEFKEFDQKLVQHFKDTRQFRLYQSNSLDITATLIERFKEHDQQAYEQLRGAYERNPDLYPHVQTLMADLSRRAVIKHSATGDEPDLISKRDLTAVASLVPKNKSPHKELNKRLVQDINKITQTLEFDDLKKRVATLNIKKLRSDIDRIQTLWQETLPDGNTSISPEVRQQKLKERERLLKKIKRQLYLAAHSRAFLHKINSTAGRHWAVDCTYCLNPANIQTL